MKIPNEKTLTLLMGWSVILLCFIFLIICILCDVSENSQRIADTAVGFVSGVLVTVISYYFGSSSGSARQAERIQEMIKPGKGDCNWTDNDGRP